MFAILRPEPELIHGAFTDNHGIHHPETVLRWPLADLARLEVYPVVEEEVPSAPGQRITGSTLAWDPDAQVVRCQWQFEPLPLDELRASQIQQLLQQCHQAIVAGFVSSALGSPHLYSSDLEDQINLLGAVLAAPAEGSLDYVCTDSSGDKRARPHTRAQLQQVFADGAQHKASLIYHFHGLRNQIEAATDPAAIAAVVWTDPT